MVNSMPYGPGKVWLHRHHQMHQCRLCSISWDLDSVELELGLLIPGALGR